jgi:hypothetical protein
MQVIKRNRETGTITPIKVIGKPVAKEAPKPAKAPAKAKPEGRVSVPKDASEGETLAFKLHNALCETDLETRNKAVFSCGKLARDIGLGDPDVAVAYEAAKRNEKSAIFQENVDTDLWEKWGVYFIGGFTAKRVVKHSGAFKPFQLIVEIPGEETRTANYDKAFEAHRAGCRWWVLKSERGQHQGMRVRYEEQEPVETDEGTIRVCQNYPSGNPKVIHVTYVEAASAAASQTSREKKGPITHQTHNPRATLGFGVKVSETRVTFSRG